MKNFLKYLFIFLSFILCIILFYKIIFSKFLIKSRFENDTINLSENIKNSPFSISKIILYSNAYGENQNTTFQQSNWILNILQYTDIAIYLDHSGENLNASNTVKKLSLENIVLSSPKLGIPSIYYLDSLNFGTANFNENDKLQNSIEFTVLNDENKNNDIQSNTPVFFTDCSNPITLKYINSAIKKNYTVTSNEPISFDGRLLQMANISLDNLKNNINFTIHIESNDNKDYYYDLDLPIVLENETSSIYNGNILIENNYENAKFLTEF